MGGSEANASPETAETAGSSAQNAQQNQLPEAKPTVPVIKEAHLIVIDKRTARKHEYTVREGSSFTHESLSVTVRACWQEPDTEPSTVIYPEHAALVDINENRGDQTSHPVFSGWMYAHKSDLSNLQHQAYDITLISCGAKAENTPPAEKKKTVEAPADETPPSD